MSLVSLAKAVVPLPIRDLLRPAYRRLGLDPNARALAEYSAFVHRARREFFLAAANFLWINRDDDIVGGQYLEFGCHNANTMRMAWDTSRLLMKWRYVACDSFEGLPEIEAIDRQPIWQKGFYATDEARFVELCTRHGLPGERLQTVKGFYDVSLTPALRERLSDRMASMVYVDCDLYASTVPVLEFVRPLLRVGSIVAFDDWNAFWGDPERGERLAFREFRERHPTMRFEPFVATHMLKSFVYVGERGA